MAAEETKTAGSKKRASTYAVPEWTTSDEIAKLIGKGVRRVQQLTSEGILETGVPPGGGARKYKTSETIQRYIRHMEEKAIRESSGGRAKDLAVKKLEAEIALKESQGKLHILKTDIAEGKYIPAERARAELTRFLSVFKKFATALPSRMAGAMAGYAEPETVRATEQAMTEEVSRMLTKFVDAASVEPPVEAR